MVRGNNMSLKQYSITAGGRVYITTQTEYNFDDNTLYLGSSNLYCTSADYNYRPYVLPGTSYLYDPSRGSSSSTRYFSITDVSVVSVRQFDLVPVLFIILLGVLTWRTLRRLFTRV